MTKLLLGVPVVAVLAFTIVFGWRTVVLVAAAVAAARLAYAAVRFARLDRAAKRNYPRAVWHRFRWRSTAHRLGLARLDPHRGGIAVPATSLATIREPGRSRLLYPRARFRADPYGLAVRLRTVPGVTRASLEEVSDGLADVWGAWRVSVGQPKPGRLTVRAFVRDPLADAFPVTSLPRFDGRHLVLGRDEDGSMRRVSLANHAGIAFSGNPGRGKTEAALSLVWQLAPSPVVELYILDGGALDWEPYAAGARAYVTELPDAVDVLHDLAAGMNERRRTMADVLGTRNMWSAGPTVDWPLRVLLVEEIPAFTHQAKGDRKREELAGQAQTLIAGLLRRGRAPGYLTVLITQKASTTGGLHPDLRDLCGLRWSFGLATTDAAASILGSDIRDYPSLSPVRLQGDEHVGVASVLLPTAGVPYTLLRFPHVGQDQADAAALELAHRIVPADVSELIPAAG